MTQPSTSPENSPSAPSELFSFALVRVDHRLVHGQVLVNWVRHLHPARIAIVDATLAADPIACDVLRSIMPPGLELWVGDASQAAQALCQSPSCEQSTMRATMILLRDIAGASQLWHAGLPFAELNIGCVPPGPDRWRIRPHVRLSRAELEVLQSLEKLGTSVTIQTLPNDRAQSLAHAARRVTSGS